MLLLLLEGSFQLEGSKRSALFESGFLLIGSFHMSFTLRSGGGSFLGGRWSFAKKWMLLLIFLLEGSFQLEGSKRSALFESGLLLIGSFHMSFTLRSGGGSFLGGRWSFAKKWMLLLLFLLEGSFQLEGSKRSALFESGFLLIGSFHELYASFGGWFFFGG